MSRKDGQVAGNNVEVADYDKTIIAGSSANLNPCTRVNEEYYEKKMYYPTVGGIGEMTLAYPRYENVDSSSGFHGGRLTLIGLNSIELTSGAGGINADTSGNINFQANGGILTLNSTGTISSTAKQIELNPNNLLAITCPVVYVEAPETTIAGNLKVGGNAQIRGGLFVNGELFCTHMTCPQQLGMTKLDSGGFGKINKDQTFLFRVDVPIISTILNALQLDIPGIIEMRGTMQSEPMLTNPLALLKPDVLVEPHSHTFLEPVWDNMDGTKDFFEDAKATESSEPVKSKDPTTVVKKKWQSLISEQLTEVKNWCLNQIGISV